MGLTAVNKERGLFVYGDKVIIAKLDKLAKMGAKRSQLRAIYNRASKPLRMAARNNAKKYKRSGTLWKSIKLTSSKKQKALFWVGPEHGKDKKFDAWYAYFIEKGTHKRTTKDGIKRGRIPSGKKFMARAYNSNKGKVRLNIIRELSKLINKIADA